MVTEYIIVEGSINPETNFDKFIMDVNDKSMEGYTPLGSPVVAGGWIMQAMTRDISKHIGVPLEELWDEENEK